MVQNECARQDLRLAKKASQSVHRMYKDIQSN